LIKINKGLLAIHTDMVMEMVVKIDMVKEIIAKIDSMLWVDKLIFSQVVDLIKAHRKNSPKEEVVPAI